MYRLVLAGVVAVLLPSAAHAAPIVDQSCCAIGPNGGTDLTLYRFQTFTVGLTGTMTGIEIGMAGGVTDPASLTLYAGALMTGQGGETFGAPLILDAPLVETGVPVPFAGVTTYRLATLGAGIAVTAGQQFTILLRDGIVGLPFYPGNPYPGGAFMTGFAPNARLSEPQGDLAFRTYVDTSPANVPEPSLVVLTVAGVAILFRRAYSSR
jgi:hypothetical protein